VFTGIVEAAPPAREVIRAGTGLRVRVPAPDGAWAVAVGESVAVAGTCLTVAGLVAPGGGGALASGSPGADMLFDLSAETVARTWFGELEPGRRLNLERSLRLGDRLSGHLVAGHVDGGATIVAIEDSGDGGEVFGFELDPGLERYLIEKGSISLDGISLTVVRPRGRRFTVAIIPLTLEQTNLGTAELGQRVNVEVDQVGKWIERLFPGQDPPS